MSQQITTPLNEPYIGAKSGGGVGPLPPDQVAIDTRSYVIDTKSGDWRREAIDVLQQRNTTSNRDVLLLPQNVWRHQDESWHKGAGQKNLDREDALQYRFHRSFGVSPWTKYEISLLNETQKIQSLLTAEPTFLQVHDEHLVVVHGARSLWHNDPANPTDSTEKALGTDSGDAISVTYDGDAVIVLTDAGKVYRLPDDATSTEVTITPPTGTPNPVTQATFIAYAKGYLLLGVGNQLWDITATQAKLVYQSPVTGFTWVGAAEGNNAIYLLGGSGDKWQVQRVSVKEDGTGLNPAITAATLPDGEIGTGIGSYLGFVFIGSTKGVRMATPGNTAGDLLLGAFVPTEAPVYGFEGQSQFMWITGSHINPVGSHGPIAGAPTSPVSGLYRADLTSFTTTESTPAYATDLYAVDGAYGTTRSVTTWDERRVFSVDGHGVYFESGNKVPVGWLESGRVSYSVEDLKTGLYAQAKWEPLAGTVTIGLSYDNKPWTTVLNWSIADTISSGNIPLNGAQFSRVDPIYILMRDKVTASKGPILTRFELRARPAKGKASRWYLPILNHEELDLNGVMASRDVNVEFSILLGLVESGKMFSLQEGNRTYQAVAVDYRWQPQKLTVQGEGWQGVFTLVAEEVR